MRTSYDINFYDLFFDWIVYSHVPKVVVDCGVLDAFSLLAFAEPAKLLGAQVWGIDLFEGYEFKHSIKSDIQKKINDKALNNVILLQKDAMLAYEQFGDNVIDILHIDISNDGDKLHEMFRVWDSKVRVGGLIIFEGGSEERDNVEWMIKYNRRPIRDFIKSELANNSKYEYVTFTPYPSVTVCRKVR